MKWFTCKRRPIYVGMVIVLAVVFGLGIWSWWMTMKMPGKSYRGPLPPLSEDESVLIYTLRQDVETLATDFAQRNLYHYENLRAAADFLESSFLQAGYEVHRYGYEVMGKTCENLEVEIIGKDRPEEIVIIGAHYDAVEGSPAANDNGSGVAALLALARAFAGLELPRTLRFVAFVNEEPPFFQNKQMGSHQYAKQCRQQNRNIIAMISLETIGYYSDAKGSQHYPFPLNFFYPSTGNFIAFVGNIPSRNLLRTVIGSFRKHTQFPSEGGAFPGSIPGVGWSDHWSFWQEGYPAIMVTDTALFRYPHYHQPTDTPDKIVFDRMARVVYGLHKVIEDLSGLNP
ncbi:MAG: M28 family peptidase [Candidatus Omnitrophota bacterium]|nr:MAG: M28 family peptidase [Candidatus Omnitrophota bacterium]